MHQIYIDRSGSWDLFSGTDQQLIDHGSFVLQRGGSQVVAKLDGDWWLVWSRVPVDTEQPLGSASVGPVLGQVRRRDGYPHIWQAHQRIDGGAGEISETPSPYGEGSIGSATEELLRLA